MSPFSCLPSLLRNLSIAFALLGIFLMIPNGYSKDYFIVLGGGPYKEQNQASMEANVQFFQRVFQEKGNRDSEVSIFFADGTDPGEDLQIIAEEGDSVEPVTDLLEKLHRRGPMANRKPVAYRNHKLQNIAGSTSVRRVRREFERLRNRLTESDRVIIYVTAHGHAGPAENPQDTSIACWGGQILASEMTSWLDQFPTETPVILVMAQCYTGGYSNTIFQDLEKLDTLSDHTRIGFFAQQFDLPAAGCRPDIEEDQEFSSYFWGAMLGETRNGVPVVDADLDMNGQISWEEAFVHMMTQGETIDIPLRSTDRLLRAFSKIPNYTLFQNLNSRGTKESGLDSYEPSGIEASAKGLVEMSGSIEQILRGASSADQTIVKQLCQVLHIDTSEDVAIIFDRHANHLRQSVQIARPRRGRGGSGRRELLAAIFEKWPELNEGERWDSASCLRERNQLEWLEEIHSLPEYLRYDKQQLESETVRLKGEQHELTSVKYRRLIETLESIVLEKNLEKFASEPVVQKFQLLRGIEKTGLQQKGHTR